MRPQNAPELSEADYVKRLIQGGISSEDAQRIAQKTFSRRLVTSSVNSRWCPTDHQIAKDCG